MAQTPVSQPIVKLKVVGIRSNAKEGLNSKKLGAAAPSVISLTVIGTYIYLLSSIGRAGDS